MYFHPVGFLNGNLAMKLGIQGLESLLLCLREGATVTGPRTVRTGGASERARLRGPERSWGPSPLLGKQPLPHNLLLTFTL